MIDRMSNQNKIGFLFGDGKLDRLNREAKEVKNNVKLVEEVKTNELKDVAELQKAKKADHHDMISRGTKIMSTTGGIQTDIGGPKKYLKSETSNSIFDTEVIERLMETKGSQEESKEIKDNIQKVRNSINAEVMNELTDNLKDTDQRKGSNVSSLSEYVGGSKYRKPVNGLSIFDDDFDFSRVPEKTAGEKVSDRVIEERGKKDNSWQKVSKSKSMQELQNKLIDSFIHRDRDHEK